MTRINFKKLICLLLAVIITASFVPPLPVVAEESEKTHSELLKDVMAGVLTVEEAFGTLDADTVPEIIGYDTAVAKTHIQRLYDEEGDDLSKVIFLNADGSRTAYYYDHPVKYVDGTGKIKDITLNIAESDVAGQFETAASSSVTTFSKNVTDGIALRGNNTAISLVPHLSTNTSKTLTAVKTASNATVRRIDNKTVAYTYDDKTTLEYSLTYTGFKEDIVVSEYTGQTRYDFTLYTNGLKLTERNGSFYLADTAGTVKAQLGDIIIFTADDRNNTMGDMIAKTVVENQEYLLTILVDPEFLADEKTAYPIRIDPTVEICYDNNGSGAIEDVTINSNGGSDGTAYSLSIGLRESYGVARILMKFPGLDLSSLGPDAVITEASVELRDLMCEDTPLTIFCYLFSGNAWTESTANWSNVNPHSLAILLSSKTISYESGTQQPNWQAYAFDITAAVEGWRAGTADPDKGILLKAPTSVEEGTTYNYKTLASYNRSSYKPTLSVTYATGVNLLEDGTYYLNNLGHGDYLRYASSSATCSSGLISSLGDSIRWELRNVYGGYVIRSKADPTKYLAVPDSQNSASLQVMTVTDYVVPERCIWRMTLSPQGGCLLINQHNSRYLCCDGTSLYTSTNLGTADPFLYSTRVWRTLSTSYYGNTSSTTYRELSSLTTINNIEGALDSNVTVSIDSYYNNEIWDSPSDFTYTYDNSGVIEGTTGSFLLNKYGGVKVVATHKVTNMVKQFYVLVGFSSTISQTPLADSIIEGLNQPYDVWPASEDSQYCLVDSQDRMDSLNNIYLTAAMMTGGVFLGYEAAVLFLDHYLDNVGTRLNINMKYMISDWPKAQECREDDINYLMQAVEASATYSDQVIHTILPIDHSVDEHTNWGYAVGQYSTSITCLYFKTSENTYSMYVTYELHDVYDWDKDKTSMGSLPVSPRQMWELHHGGMAKNYEVYGKNTFILSWTEGQTFGNGAVMRNET